MATPSTNADHQPKEGPVTRKPTTSEQLETLCKDMIAFILAYQDGSTPLKVEFEDDSDAVVLESEEGTSFPRPLQVYEGKPCVEWAVELACASHVAAAVVVTSPSLKSAIEGIVAKSTSGNTTPVSVLTYDNPVPPFHTLSEKRALYSVPYSLLGKMRESAAALSADYQHVLILSCDQVRIRREHVLELAEDVLAHPQAEAGVS